MPTPDPAGKPSLLPYLNPPSPGIALRLDIQYTATWPEALSASHACGPFTTLRSGQIVVDGHRLMDEILVLSQSDAYAFDSSELTPVTNLDVEETWQRAWKKIQSATGSAPIVLPAQVDAESALIPVRPLFYCRQMERYGHALCPFCGGELMLCRDDDALQKAGLATYVGSLQRFLYCPICHHASAPAPFYQHPVSAQPPAGVQGCRQLLENFSRLLTKSELAHDLPCIGCGETANCYGPETLVLQRMAPVQFYPFHMLILKAPALNALDFLALLSGAPMDAIQTALVRDQKHHRLQLFNKLSQRFAPGSGYLFAGETRLFAEVLYLKLSFLHEVCALIMDGATGPVNRMSMEGLGVVLADQGARLPWLWNFALKIIDPIGQPSVAARDSETAQTPAGEFLGLAWYYVLLVNAGQSMAGIQAALERLRLSSTDGSESAALFDDPVFAPGNLFWDAPVLELAPGLRELWAESLALGLGLLQANALDAPGRAIPEVEHHLMDLRNRVHQRLFQTQTASDGHPTEGRASADDRIADILSALLGKWLPATTSEKETERADALNPSSRLSGKKPNEDGDFEETIILAKTDGAHTDDATEETPANPALEKTVLIPAAAMQAAGSQLDKTMVTSVPPPAEAQSHLAETVVIKTPAHWASETDPEKTVVLASPSRPVPEDDLEKTVMIGKSSHPGGEDDLEKTILQPHAGGRVPRTARSVPRPSNSEPVERPEAEDDLEATVIMQPRSGKDRKPKS